MQTIPLNFEAMGLNMLPGNNSMDHEADFTTLIGSVISIVMIVALLILLFFLIWGAIEWMTSSGDNTKLQNARNRMLHAIVGVLVLSATIAIFMFVQYLLGIEVLTFEGRLPGGTNGVRDDNPRGAAGLAN